MASKPKLSGCTSERRVTEAMKKCGCEGIEFFRLAAAYTNAASDVEISWARFQKFQERGVPDTNYQLPGFVMSFTEKIHSPACNATLLVHTLRAATRPRERYHVSDFSTQGMATA